MEKQRNYQIDCLKLLMAIFVLICHSRVFVGANGGFISDETFQQMGCWAVHIFYIISG